MKPCYCKEKETIIKGAAGKGGERNCHANILMYCTNVKKKCTLYHKREGRNKGGADRDYN